MMSRTVQVFIHIVLLAATTLGKNQQSWSHHTYNDEPYSLICKSTNALTATDDITWNRDGKSGELMNDDHYELRTVNGVNNAELYVKNVKDDLHGIYVCHIRNSSGDLVESVVLGMNVGTRLYHEDIDKYRDNIIVGAISAGSILFLIISACLISQFRYLSEESLEKRRQRKEDRLRRNNNGAMKNPAYTAEMTEGNYQTNGSSVVETSYVHF